MHGDGAERYLRSQLNIQAQTMARRGVEQEALLEEIHQLETEIRVTAWKLNRPPQRPGGAA
jgi:hypothetical protein